MCECVDNFFFLLTQKASFLPFRCWTRKTSIYDEMSAAYTGRTHTKERTNMKNEHKKRTSKTINHVKCPWKAYQTPALTTGKLLKNCWCCLLLCPSLDNSSDLIVLWLAQYSLTVI